MQHCICSLMTAEYRGIIASLDLLAMLLVTQTTLCCQGIWSLFRRVAALQAVFLQGLLLCQVQDFTFFLVVLCKVPVSPLLQPIQVSLDGSPAFALLTGLLQFHAIFKLDVSAIHHLLNRTGFPYRP